MSFDQFEFYKELYFKENERRISIDSALNIPIIVTTALVAGIYVLATSMSFHDVWLTILFALPIIVAAAFLFISIYWICTVFVTQGAFFFSTTPPTYAGIPFVGRLSQWHDQLEQYYRAHYANDPNVATLADDEFKKYLVSEFIRSVDQNTHANDNKFSQIFNANKALVRSLYFVGLSIPFYFWSFFTKPESVINSRISGDSLNVHLIDKHMLELKSNERSTTKAAAADSTGPKPVTSTISPPSSTTTAWKTNKRGSGISKTPRLERKIKSNHHGRRKQTCTKGDTAAPAAGKRN